jgi:dihydroorotate dehydrogenase (fumarate)/dihydropyrimidine dehydrogenase (NAD+) subunit PreA
MANTKVEFCGHTFKNPVVVASLETTNSPDLMRQCFDAGASAVVIKTLTDIEDMARLTQNSKYCIMNDRGDVVKGKVQRDFVFYSRSGYSSTYYKDWIPDLIDTQKYAAERGAHLIGSVGAKDINGWKDISRTVEDCGLPMVELNFGCPHPAMMPGVHGGSMIGQEADVAFEVTRAVSDAGSIPVMGKLTPDQSRPVEVAQAVRFAGAAAVTATNRHTGFAVDIDTGEPRLAGPAGIGGTWVKPLSLRWVHRIHRELGIPISGSNGIFDHRDVVEFIMTGASIVQVGSILMAKGIKWLPKIIDGFEKFMDAHGYATVEEMIGIASRRSVKDYAEQFNKQRKYAEIVHDTCKNRPATCASRFASTKRFHRIAPARSTTHGQLHRLRTLLRYLPIRFHSHAADAAGAAVKGFFDIPDGVFEHEKFKPSATIRRPFGPTAQIRQCCRVSR